MLSRSTLVTRVTVFHLWSSLFAEGKSLILAGYLFNSIHLQRMLSYLLHVWIASHRMMHLHLNCTLRVRVFWGRGVGFVWQGFGSRGGFSEKLLEPKASQFQHTPTTGQG